MDRSLQISLLEELQGLAEHGHFFLDPVAQPSPVSRYASELVFEAEMRDIFRQAPLIAAHASELPEEGSFMTIDLAGLPVLLTRDREGQVHAFSMSAAIGARGWSGLKVAANTRSPAHTMPGHGAIRACCAAYLTSATGFPISTALHWGCVACQRLSGWG